MIKDVRGNENNVNMITLISRMVTAVTVGSIIVVLVKLIVVGSLWVELEGLFVCIGSLQANSPT